MRSSRAWALPVTAAPGLTAPVVEGQMRALERAYAKAGVSPATVGYVEAHGTGTALGDVVEIDALEPAIPGNWREPARMHRRLGQVDDRAHQMRRRSGGADQRLARALSQCFATHDRNRAAQSQARFERGPAQALHPEPALAASPSRSTAPGRRERIRIWRHQLPRRSRGVR